MKSPKACAKRRAYVGVVHAVVIRQIEVLLALFFVLHRTSLNTCLNCLKAEIDVKQHHMQLLRNKVITATAHTAVLSLGATSGLNFYIGILPLGLGLNLGSLSKGGAGDVPQAANLVAPALPDSPVACT